MALPVHQISSSASDFTDSSSESEDSQYDPSFDIADDIDSGLSRLSINRSSKARGSDQSDEKNQGNDEDNFQKLIEAGNLEKLKVDQCKLYLRKHGLRLTGTKETLIQRIKEHLEICNGDGEKKYPASSFVVNCKGDACTGDVVLFEQNVYEMYSIASRSATGPPCGTRMVAGRIIKESYGTAKQQHTFTIEVLWSRGEKPLPPLHPLLIKGRNLYRLKTMRQKWDDEGKRQKMLDEKHARGNEARSNREARVNEKEKRMKRKTNRVVDTIYIPGKAGNSGISQQKKPTKMQNHSQAENLTRLPEPCPKMDDFSELLRFKRQPLSNQSYNMAGAPINHYPFSSGYGSSVNETMSNNHAVSHLQRYSSNQERKSSETTRSSFQGPYGSSNPHVHQAARNEIFKGVEHRISSTSNKNLKQVCQYYPRGRCYFGDNCKYLHVNQGN